MYVTLFFTKKFFDEFKKFNVLQFLEVLGTLPSTNTLGVLSTLGVLRTFLKNFLFKKVPRYVLIFKQKLLTE
jgi:uncharacterized membrane protein